MKKRNILFIAVCFFMLFALTGCGNKTVITTSDFKTIAEKHDYTIIDATSQFVNYNMINEATIAKSPDGWQVEFYVLSDEASATSMFNTNKTTFESYKVNTSSESSVNMENYSSYTLTSRGYYMHLCRVENTLLFVRVDDAYKSEVKDLIKELGY